VTFGNYPVLPVKSVYGNFDHNAIARKRADPIPGNGQPKNIKHKTLEAIEQEWVRLTRARKNVGKTALNFEDAFQLLRIFNQEFHEKAAHEQCEIVKEVIHRIVVNEDGITVEYYAGPREDVLSGRTVQLLGQRNQKRTPPSTTSDGGSFVIRIGGGEGS
jgi:hypothetical protein